MVNLGQKMVNVVFECPFNCYWSMKSIKFFIKTDIVLILAIVSCGCYFFAIRTLRQQQFTTWMQVGELASSSHQKKVSKLVGVEKDNGLQKYTLFSRSHAVSHSITSQDDYNVFLKSHCLEMVFWVFSLLSQWNSDMWHLFSIFLKQDWILIQ